METRFEEIIGLYVPAFLGAGLLKNRPLIPTVMKQGSDLPGLCNRFNVTRFVLPRVL